ncbi:MAG: outer membrane protein assembly factor BamD [Snodgrassella sp.]|nr:outer membrane protein assembly factor BamD [Snodgrassella sp.]
MKNLFLAVALGLLLTACASTSTVDKDSQTTQNWSVQRLYTEAHDELMHHNYTHAEKLYEILQARFPYGAYAEQAQLDTAYAYYKDSEPEKALAAIEQFQRLYPKHTNMDYALYLKALIQLNEDKSLVSKIAKQDWSDRDPKANREAYTTFAELLERFPNSKYVNDAREKMQKLLNALAGHELSVARYYMKRGAWLAAVGRAQTIISEYQNTPNVEEALAIMVSAYQNLGEQQLSDDAKRVLVQNFPNSPYRQMPWRDRNDIPWWRYWK